MKIKKTIGEHFFDAFNLIFMIFIIVVMLFPFVNQLALAFSNNASVLAGYVSFFPVNFTVSAFKAVFSDGRFFLAFRNSVFYTLVFVILQVSLTAMAAFPLSRSHLKGRKWITYLLLFSMMFGTGGLIPNFLIIKELGLVDSYWSLWLPGMVNIWNLIIVRSFYSQLPDSLIESAEIDGAGQFRILIQLVLPLSLAPLATITLFSAVSAWNSYFNAMIYINSPEKKLLAVFLRDVVQSHVIPTSPEAEIAAMDARQRVAPYSIRAATIMSSTIPIVLVYPFLQKYFVKGMMIGALKG